MKLTLDTCCDVAQWLMHCGAGYKVIGTISGHGSSFFEMKTNTCLYNVSYMLKQHKVAKMNQ